MKKRISVSQIKVGIYVAELDRPWTETPFLYQGFIVESDEQISVLREYCKSVTVDFDKSPVLFDRADLLTGSGFDPAVDTGGSGILSSIVNRVVYHDSISLKEEFPLALEARRGAELTVSRALEAVYTQGVIDAEELKKSTSTIRESIVRNPGAMMLLSRIREKSERILHRALSVSVLMITFGRYLQLPQEQLDLLGMAGLLQDIGMTNIPEEVLEKTVPLSKVEKILCRSHVAHTIQILGSTRGVPPEVLDIASKHHERYHGSGYPKGLQGGEIGLPGAIAGLVDFYDALTKARPYAETYSPSNALNQIYNARNVLFDGALAEQFIQCLGIFPVGSFVELNSGEVGIVIAQDPAKKLLPRVMLVLDARGAPIKPQLIIDLAGNPLAAPRVPYRIKRALREDVVPINPAECIL